MDGLMNVFRRLTVDARKDGQASVVVGYTARYGLWVHENLQNRHPVGQAKFLEAPARQLSSDGTLAKIVSNAKKRGLELGTCLLLAGLRLQREAMRLTPVDTGALRASAFTRRES
jgi:hypothetical protein